MRKAPPLIVTALFAATYALGNDCTSMHLKSTTDTNFTIVQDNGRDDFEIVSFCEPAADGHKDYVVDFLMLGVENAKTYLFIHEFVATSTTAALIDEGWFVLDDKDLTGADLTSFRATRKGTCKTPGDFTRSVNTGSGTGGDAKKKKKAHKGSKGGGTTEIDLCGHGKDSGNNALITYSYNGP